MEYLHASAEPLYESLINVTSQRASVPEITAFNIFVGYKSVKWGNLTIDEV